MALLEQKTVLAAKIESTYGVGPGLSTTDAIIVQNPKVKIEQAKYEPNFIGNHVSSFAPFFGQKKISLDFETFFYTGLDAGDVAPRINRLFRACGIRDIQSAGVSYQYKPAIVYPHESITASLYKDGILYKATGCRGKCRIYSDTTVCKIAWSLQGLLSDNNLWSPIYNDANSNPKDTAIITPDLTGDPGWNTPPSILGATASWGALSGVNLKIKSFELNIDNTLTPVDSVGNTTGLGEVAITKRTVTGKMVVMATVEATESWWADLFSRTLNALSIQWGVTGNRIRVSSTGGAGALITNLEPVDLGGVMGYAVDFILQPTAGDDEFTLTID